MTDRTPQPSEQPIRREPVDLIGDELCRTSFGDFKEPTLRKIAARLVGRLHAAGYYFGREAASAAPDPVASPAPLDVERLRRAMELARPFVDFGSPQFYAPAVAREYERLGQPAAEEGR